MPRSVDRASGDSTTLFAEHLGDGKMPAQLASVHQHWTAHSHRCGAARGQYRPSFDTARGRIKASAKARLARAQFGAGALHVAAPAKPFVHVRAKPPNRSPAEFVLLRESAENRESGEKPAMAARQPRYVTRCQDLIPRWESFVDPAGERNIRGSRS